MSCRARRPFNPEKLYKLLSEYFIVEEQEMDIHVHVHDEKKLEEAAVSENSSGTHEDLSPMSVTNNDELLSKDASSDTTEAIADVKEDAKATVIDGKNVSENGAVNGSELNTDMKASTLTADLTEEISELVDASLIDPEEMTRKREALYARFGQVRLVLLIQQFGPAEHISRADNYQYKHQKLSKYITSLCLDASSFIFL